MRIIKPQKVTSGFHAESVEADVAEIRHLGEQWVPADFEISRHSHSVWELYFQLDGWSVWRDADGGECRCDPGSLYAAPPRMEHWLERTSRGQHHFYFVAIDIESVIADRLPTLKASWPRRGVVHRRHARGCQDAFRQLIREATSDRPFRTAGLRAALDMLIVEVARVLCRPAAGQRSLLPLHPAVEATRNALDAQPTEPWHLAELARLGGVSPNHLAVLFRREIGSSPHRYLLQRRIELAKDLISRTDASVTSIAHELGFASSQHFARAFRQLVGKTATVYRSRHKKTRTAHKVPPATT